MALIPHANFENFTLDTKWSRLIVPSVKLTLGLRSPWMFNLHKNISRWPGLVHIPWWWHMKSSFKTSVKRINLTKLWGTTGRRQEKWRKDCKVSCQILGDTLYPSSESWLPWTKKQDRLTQLYYNLPSILNKMTRTQWASKLNVNKFRENDLRKLLRSI